jgi:two-component system, chemotaxis family, protein-glutamate methylesterase/glutaminase
MGFRCRVGHRHSTTSLMAGKREAVEAAVWAAIVALEERRDLARRIRERIRPDEHTHLAHRYYTEMAEIDSRLKLLRDLFDGLVLAGLTADGLDDD